MRYISSDYGRLYNGSAPFPETVTPDFHDMASLDGQRYGIDLIGEVFPATAYGQTFSREIFVQDNAFTNSLLPLYDTLGHRFAPPCLLMRITNARVFTSTLYAGPADDVRVLYETHRVNDRPATALASEGQLAAADRPSDYNHSTVYMFLGSAGSSNYAHFIADDMARLKGVELLRAIYPGRQISIVMTGFGGLIDLVRKDAVRAACGPDVQTVFLEPDRAYRFPLLHYPTPVSHHPVRKHVDAIDYVVDRTEKAFSGEALGERIFISRGATTSRVLINEREIIDRLRPLGFQVLRTDTLPFDRQVSAMRKAKIVIGQMGAAMTNTLFAPKGADLLYLAPSGWIEPFYWDLAVVRQQQYNVVYGTITSTGLEPNYSDFRIDLDEMMASPMLSGPPPLA